jgi:cell division protein FtsI/penicillin-binding protein 2
VDLSEVLILNSVFPEKGKVFSPFGRKFKISLIFGLLVLLIIAFNIVELAVYLDKKYKERISKEQNS